MWLNKRKRYPVSYNQIAEHPMDVIKIFVDERPHKGCFIGVSALEGTFLCDSCESLYEYLEIGELLELCVNTDCDFNVRPIVVKRIDKTELGVIPKTSSILPTLIFNRSLKLFGFLEAKKLQGGLLFVGISIYCEMY